MSNKKGKVTQIIGPVVDFKFDAGQLPEQGNAIEINKDNGDRLVFETMQHLGDDVVRTVAMGSTDGLIRGMFGENTGAPITVPVGKETLGRIMNVTGDAIDFDGPIKAETKLPILREAPAFEEQSTSTEMFVTGIKLSTC